MARDLKIAVLGDSFIEWGGGVDFLRHCLGGLSFVADEKSLGLCLMVPQRRWEARVRKRWRWFGEVIMNLLDPGGPGVVRNKPLGRRFIEESFRHAGSGKFAIRYYRGGDAGLADVIGKERFDVALPAMYSHSPGLPVPWVGYLYDFQHKYLPELFDRDEIRRRDRHFEQMLTQARCALVNAKAVKDDVRRFYPEAGCKIFDLPFAPYPLPAWFSDDVDRVRTKYRLRDPYLLICNQFFVHKSHVTAFDALAVLAREHGIEDLHIVCTGELKDHRFPGHVKGLLQRVRTAGLSARIRFLGYVPKRDQIQIMRGAAAVIQPSLFEGGPGGGAVYDALAVGTPCVVSDIPINREIGEERVRFFRAGSADDLAAKIVTVLHRPPRRESPDRLLMKGRENQSLLGNRLIEAIDYVLP